MSSGKILTLYFDWASPPSRAVISFLKMANVKRVYYSEIRLTKNDHKKEDFMKVSPLGTLPTIKEEFKESF